MTNLYKGIDVRLGQLGRIVTRPTKVIPQAAAESLFTVTGGNIIVTGLIGEVTTIMDAVATTLRLGFTPSAAGTAAIFWSAASADITGLAAGVHIYLPAAAASALPTDTATGGGYIDVTPQWFCPPGAVTLTGTGLNTGGRIKWDLLYIPLDDATNVVAA